MVLNLLPFAAVSLASCAGVLPSIMHSATLLWR
jgi:hypothetical protein